MEGTSWDHAPQMRETFGSADPVGSRVVFNIGGNKARLIAVVNFSQKRVVVEAILSRADYDRMEWE